MKTSPSRSSRRRGLDRPTIVATARNLINEVGFERLTIKDVAATLGVRSPSLYSHFENLDELRRELALEGFRCLHTCLRDAAVGLQGSDALMEMAWAYLQFIRAEPGLYAATVATPAPEDTVLREAANQGINVFFVVLESCGVEYKERIHILRGIRSIVHGFGTLESHGAFVTEVDRNESFTHALESFIDAAMKRVGAGAL